MRSGKARDEAQAEAERKREAYWRQELETVKQEAKEAKQAHEASAHAASEAHATAMQTQAATLRAEFEKQMEGREAELKEEGQRALSEAVARAVADEKSHAAVAKVLSRFQSYFTLRVPLPLFASFLRSLGCAMKAILH